jgi:hypothetical protein
MTFRALAMASAVACLLFALAFLLVPGPVMTGYRLGLNLSPPDAQHLTLGRGFGVALLMTAAATWGVRGLGDDAFQRAFARGIAAATLVGVVVYVHAVSTAAVNAMGWSSVALFAVFSLLWGRLGWKR